jgi:hypothetical protein
MIAIRRTRTSSVITASMLALACMVAVRCASPTAHSGPPQTVSRNHYGAIVDAGSSGSRIAIFEWRIAGTGDPHVWPVASMDDTDVDPKGCPLTSLPTDEGRVCGCLRALTTVAHAEAARFLGEPRLPAIALWVKATAGLRYEQDAARRDAALTATTRCLGAPTITDGTSRYHWKGARVISGEEEGVYAWLAVNHAARTLRGDLGATFGIVEIGGKSAQIAFRVAGATLPRDARGQILAVPLASGTLHVYALSQELGQNAAKESLGKDVVDKDCGRGGHTARCIAGIARFLCPDTSPGACEHRRPDLAPPGAMPFAGLSNFAYAGRNLGLADLPLDTVRDRATRVCDASYDARARDAFLMPAGRYGDAACFSALYATQVAERAWGIPAARISPPRAEWADPSWPLGAMMMEALASTTSRQ